MKLDAIPHFTIAHLPRTNELHATSCLGKRARMLPDAPVEIGVNGCRDDDARGCTARVAAAGVPHIRRVRRRASYPVPAVGCAANGMSEGNSAPNAASHVSKTIKSHVLCAAFRSPAAARRNV